MKEQTPMCANCQFARQTLDTNETFKVKLVIRCSLGNQPDTCTHTCTQDKFEPRQLFGI